MDYLPFRWLLSSLLIGLMTSVVSSTQEPGWSTSLPDCPCRNPDEQGITMNDGWARDKGDIGYYHPGAQICFRSYPYTLTSAGKSCQQCCYNAKGLLIKKGSGAGTPDKVSTCAGEDKWGDMITRYAGLAGHYWKDVRPWKQAGAPENAWKRYNVYWIPNPGKNCPSPTRDQVTN